MNSILNAHKELLVVTEFNIVIKAKLQNLLYEFAQRTKAKSEDSTKDIIKNELKKSLKLKTSDIILFKKEYIFIKISNDKKQQKQEKRFNGIDENELKDFYDEYFSKTRANTFFDKVVSKFSEKYFLEKMIDNNNYENNVFSYKQAIILQVLLEDFDGTSEFLKGFSGYIFRLHFNDIFDSVASFTLKEIAESNEYMIEFLKYYSLNIVIVDGVKYKVPLLRSDDGMKLSYISMLSISKMYTRAKDLTDKLRHEIDDIQSDMFKLYKDERTPLEYNNYLINQQKNINDKLNLHSNKLRENADLIQTTKEENNRSSYRQKISVINQEMIDMQKNISELSAKKIDILVLNRFSDLNKKLETKKRDLKVYAKVLSKNSISFLSMRKSLVRVLIAKKEKL